MGQGQDFADALGPERHAAEGEEVAGKEDRGEEDEEGHLHRLELILGDGGKHDAHGQIGQNKNKRGGEKERDAAQDGHAEHEMGHDEDEAELNVADENVGRDFPDQNLEGPRWHGEQVFHRAAFPLARDGEAGDHDHGHGEDDAHEARDDVVLRVDLRIIKRVDLHIEGSGGVFEIGERAFEIVLQGGVENAVDGADGIPGRDGIGGVGLDQDRGAVAAQEVPRKVFWDVDDEEGVAALERLFPLGLGFAQLDEIEIGGVLERVKNGAAMRAVIGEQHFGGEMARVHIDGEAEENELEQRECRASSRR